MYRLLPHENFSMPYTEAPTTKRHNMMPLPMIKSFSGQYMENLPQIC